MSVIIAFLRLEISSKKFRRTLRATLSKEKREMYTSVMGCADPVARCTTLL